MLRLAGFDIVFQEVPGEVTLALNLSGCPNGCAGCHSPHLQGEVGEVLDEGLLAGLIAQYGGAVTCVCFMGGDREPEEVERLARVVKTESGGRLKTGWYSGRQQFPAGCSWSSFDFVKLGPYVERLGGLDSATTNQVFYKIENEAVSDITEYFRKRTT
ncbi:anaerobic ribonucleoside-triphosphate reductase activating protein [Alistipes sp. OttesenSCG-928-B03]|nr:anaerobic ribonucleoside-triphosphate reductase activating protein [Alistipes sp. OttesenSCG-928-B03]